MIRSARLLRLTSLAAAVAAATLVVAAPETAQADRVRIRVGGAVRVSGHAHVRIGGPRYRYRPRYVVRSYPRPYIDGFYWGVRFAEPPPPPPPSCYYECGAVTTGYYAPEAPVAVATIAPEPEPRARFGVGLFGGSVDVEGNDAGGDLGLLGRLRLSRHFALEAELSKTEISDGARVDRRVGASLLYDFSPDGSLAPYVLAGAGFGQSEMDDGRFTAEQGYGELGVGLEWRLTDHLSLLGDLRAGTRQSTASEEEILLVRGGPATIDEEENFTRARLGGILYF